MRLNAELWDRIQYLFRNYYDRMMHAAVYLDGELDAPVLKRAFSIMLEKVPVLRGKYVPSPVKPYWEISEDKDLIEKAFTLVQSIDPMKESEQFLTGRFESDNPPGIRMALFRKDGKDILCMLVNHQCFDGGDFKQFIYKLAEIYNDLKKGGNGDIAVKSGTRANSQVYSTMTPEDRKTAMGLFKNVSKTKHPIAFPFTEDKEHAKSMIVKSKIDASTFDKLKAYGKKFDSTVNDVILALYFRSLYQLVNLDQNQCITIPCMTDLRRHIESGETAGFTNLTCLIPCTIDSVGPEFPATLKKVHGEMNRFKNDKFVGLSGIPLLELAYRLFPSALAEIAIKIGYTNPFIGMSNIGIIDENKVEFSGIKPSDAFMTGAIKFKPYMQLALTTFKKEVTMTICIYGTASDRAIIEKFFRIYQEEILKIV